MDTLKRLAQKSNEATLFKKCDFTFCACVELPNGSTVATGYLAVIMKVKVFNLEYNTVIGVVPVTVQIGIDFSLENADKIGNDYANCVFTDANYMLNPSLGLSAFGGVGVGKVVGVGAYGNANLAAKINLFGTQPGLRSVDLTGELGMKAYFAWCEYHRAFAHQTWHLYTANTVDSAALLSAAPAWNEGLYDASAYAPDDLGYLTAESDWLGAVRGGSRLLAASAEAKTEFKSLLTDTYRNAQPVMVSSGDALYAAFVRADAESGSRYVVVTKSEDGTSLASGVSGRVRYGVLPGTDEAAFLWNGDGMLYSSNGDEVSAEGITHEYAIVGDKIYYSVATDNSANLAVLQYDDGNWSLPIQLTGDSRYLENLSAARLNGEDIVMGMYTAVTITEDSVEDAKNLVVSRVMPVSDLRIDGVDYDDSDLTAGESVPVTVTVINAGDHTVNSIDLSLDGTLVKTENVALLPGQSVEIETEITCPSVLTSYVFAVSETDESDYTPTDNEYELNVGYADAALELDYQQIGTSKALVATVTNQGIDAASGSVIFYDADGNPVAESTFENLTSGDIAIASYAVTESFAGVDGGDVSAKVVLEQDELHAYNNEATMHILKPYTPTSVKSISKLQGGIAAEVVFGEDVHATVLCATYDSAGKMLHVESESVDALEGETYTFDFVAEDADVVKVFVLDDDAAPLCEAREPVMQTE